MTVTDENMFVRVKRIGSKRYAYLVEGLARNGRVRQKTLAYLGPITRLASGVPQEIRDKIDRRIAGIDWTRINETIRDIPLTFGELSDMKRRQLPTILAMRQDGSQNRSGGSMPRTDGELSALTIIARNRFDEMFEHIGERRYRMR
ncbi:hypothetical protein J2P12_08585 [Candidatus Bathyarchaeota archaeon]|nr:hypothetical protein [Candidatus Bathyarchaeota archaeon]